jgi:hypothetical protein
LRTLDQLAEARVMPENAARADWLAQNVPLFQPRPDSAFQSETARYRTALSDLAARVQWESRTAVAWFDGTGVDEHVLLRGKPSTPGPLAPRRLPGAFAEAAPISSSGSSGRSDLARQLTDPANPLVARVMVNRVWHHLFGRGIVATVDNFGELGERPSHPELLDYLAWRFVHEDRWSLKRLIKRLALTRTFAMGSLARDSQAATLDPSNVLLHRMPVRRLEGEAIRDALLTVSGRLSRSIGGPPEPLHLTEFLVGRGRPEKSGPLDGSGRRSVYSALRRNFLPTLMAAFDAPTPFSTVGRRNVTNVPAQSLALMNDPLFHQQAEVWARRLLREAPAADLESRIHWLFESAFARPARPAEIAACTATLSELRQMEIQSQADSEGDLRVWAELCHALLNANEFIFLP